VEVVPDGRYHKILQFDYDAEPQIEKVLHDPILDELDELCF